MELTYHVRKMRALLEAGKSFDECRKALGLTSEEYDRVRKVCCEEEAKRIREKSKEEIYSEYVVEQRKCLAALERIIDRPAKDGKGSDTALLNAIKIKSEIEDKIIEKGQELGILEKVGKKMSSGPVVVTDMEDAQTKKMRDEDLRDSISNEAMNLERVTNKFQGKSLSEISVPQIYRKSNKPIDLEKRELEKHHKANTFRVQGGRPGFLRYRSEDKDG